MDKYQRVRLSKILSYVLRHRPDEYGLVLDEQGYVSIKELIQALHEEREWSFVRQDHLQEIVLTSGSPRFEIWSGKIRALYGHSTPTRIIYEPSPPPPILYHGTRRRAYPTILQQGLKPMGRQYVHLATTKDMALRIGRRRDPQPVLLEVQAFRAHQEGILFYRAQELIYLVEYLPPRFLSGPPLSKLGIERKTRKEEKTKPALHPADSDLGLLPFLPPRGPRKKDTTPDWKREIRRWRRKHPKGGY